MGKKVTVYPRFALISESEEAETKGYCPKCGQAWAVHNDDGSCVEDTPGPEEQRELRKWLQESAWIYPKVDEKFLPFLEKRMKDHFGAEFRLWQNKDHLKSGEYPQYLCSADLRGIGGDVCQLWRDGQSWWPMCGDYSLDDEENVELILRKAIREFRKEGQR